MTVDYLSLADVLVLHDEIVARTGGPPVPLWDEGSLEAAIPRPRMAAYYEEADLVRQATLLAVGISQAQAFVDGNKRTAYSAAETFLLLNKHRLTGASIELARHFELIAEEFGDREEAVERFEAWLRGPVVPRPG